MHSFTSGKQLKKFVLYSCNTMYHTTKSIGLKYFTAIVRYDAWKKKDERTNKWYQFMVYHYVNIE